MSLRTDIERVCIPGVVAEIFAENLSYIGHKLKDAYVPYLNVVDFTEGRIRNRFWVCGTVACHGGWIFKLFTPPLYNYTTRSYRDGICVLDNILGLYQYKELTGLGLPHPNPHEVHHPSTLIALMSVIDMWGYPHTEMFSVYGYRSFGFDHHQKDKCNLTTIGDHYITVANRILTNLEDEDKG